MVSSPDQPALLSVQRLSGPSGGSVQVQNVNFSLRPSEALAIVGPKGAGKTTLLDLMSCLKSSAAGRVIYQGRDVLSLAPYRLARLGLALVGEQLSLLKEATVLDNLLLARHGERRTGLLQHVFFPPWVRNEEVNHRRRVEEVIEVLDLHSARHRKICDLPSGVRRFVDLGRALVLRPRLVLGDELFRGLSPAESAAMARALRLVRRSGVSLVLTGEDEGVTAGVADRVAHMEAGVLRLITEREVAPS